MFDTLQSGFYNGMMKDNAPAAVESLIANIEMVFAGGRDTVELAAIALFSQGHLLIVDLPGVGKTTLAKALSRSIGGTARRVQFTPDLLPSDITGVTIYRHEKDAFEFHPGPVFCNVLLADEINRATPRTQSSLLEAMEESQVSVDGSTYPLEAPFMVIATQNPVEVQGTFPLPEAQLDRFLISISMGYPSREQETRIMRDRAAADPLDALAPVLTVAQALDIANRARQTHVSPAVMNYILDIVNATRRSEEILLGASPRASLALMRAAQTRALFRGREFVTPEDIKALAAPVLAHRVILRAATRLNLNNNQAVISGILSRMTVPINA